MASEKNITMKEFNGTDYDTLYPKTKIEQVEGLSNKLNNIDSNINNLDYKIGDVQITARTELNSNWLECNGQFFNNELYPDLAKILPNNPLGQWDKIKELNIIITKLYHDDLGKWIAIGYDLNGYPTICITKNLGNDWEIQKIANSKEILTDIYKGQGYYVVIGYTNETVPVPIVYYAITNHGPWVRTELSSMRKGVKLTGVFYNGEWWVIAGTENIDATPVVIYFKSAHATGPWIASGTAISGAFSGTISCQNGLWVMGTSTNRCYITRNLDTSTFQARIIKKGSYVAYNIIPYKGNWVAFASIDGNISDISYISETDLETKNVEWNTGGRIGKTINRGFSCFSTSDLIAVTGQTPNNEIIVCLFSSLIENGTIITIIPNYTAYETKSAIYCYEGNWAASYMITDGKSNIYSHSNSLPNIQLDKVKAYIKAK